MAEENQIVFESPFEELAKYLTEGMDPGDELPAEILYKVMSHGDETHFFDRWRPSIELTGIVGPYTVYDYDGAFLYRMNLHKGAFNTTLPELDYFRKQRDFSIVYIMFQNEDGVLRNVQAIWRKK